MTELNSIISTHISSRQAISVTALNTSSVPIAGVDTYITIENEIKYWWLYTLELPCKNGLGARNNFEDDIVVVRTTQPFSSPINKKVPYADRWDVSYYV